MVSLCLAESTDFAWGYLSLPAGSTTGTRGMREKSAERRAGSRGRTPSILGLEEFGERSLDGGVGFASQEILEAAAVDVFQDRAEERGGDRAMGRLSRVEAVNQELGGRAAKVAHEVRDAGDFAPVLIAEIARIGVADGVPFVFEASPLLEEERQHLRRSGEGKGAEAKLRDVLVLAVVEDGSPLGAVVDQRRKHTP